MKTIPLLAAVAALFLAAPVVAKPAVEVIFTNPDGYTDATPRSHLVDEKERDATLALLREHLQSLGAKYLHADDRLRIEVLDVDLAGELRLWRLRGRDVRVLRDVTMPRIHLKYALVRAGIESAGADRLVDPNYLRESVLCRTGGALCHEKLLLDEWFVRRFADKTARRHP
ncbi:MAG: DUF3016 domain-containing protein [Burkholderiaceae bacterium]